MSTSDAATPAVRYDVIVPAGGQARRLGTDKTRSLVDGMPLLDRVLDAATGACHIVVVGEPRPTTVLVTWTREEPPGGGPAAAVAAGLALVTEPIVVLLAADLPFVTASAVRRLVAAAATGNAGDVGSGAALCDESGREQWLASAWPVGLLRSASLRPGGSLRAALQPLRPRRLAADRRTVLDCDTPADLELARAIA